MAASDDEDLEALRLAALATIKNKPLEEQEPQGIQVLRTVGHTNTQVNQPLRHDDNPDFSGLPPQWHQPSFSPLTGQTFGGSHFGKQYQPAPRGRTFNRGYPQWGFGGRGRGGRGRSWGFQAQPSRFQAQPSRFQAQPSRFQAPPLQPNNALIVIKVAGQEEPTQPPPVQPRPSESRSLLLRPQDKWAGAKGSQAMATETASKPKDTSKFGRYADDSESEDEEERGRRRRQDSESEHVSYNRQDAESDDVVVEVHKTDAEVHNELDDKTSKVDNAEKLANEAGTTNGNEPEKMNESLAYISDIVLDAGTESNAPGQETAREDSANTSQDSNVPSSSVIDTTAGSDLDNVAVVSSTNDLDISASNSVLDVLKQDDSVSNSYSSFSRFNRRRNRSDSENSDDSEVASLPISRKSSFSGSGSQSNSRSNSRASTSSNVSKINMDIDSDNDKSAGSDNESEMLDNLENKSAASEVPETNIDHSKKKTINNAKNSDKGNTDTAKPCQRARQYSNSPKHSVTSSSSSESSSESSSDSSSDSELSSSSNLSDLQNIRSQLQTMKSKSLSHKEKPIAQRASHKSLHQDSGNKNTITKTRFKDDNKQTSHSRAEQTRRGASDRKISSNKHTVPDKYSDTGRHMVDEKLKIHQRQPDKDLDNRKDAERSSNYKAEILKKRKDFHNHKGKRDSSSERPRSDKSHSFEGRKTLNRKEYDVKADPEFDAANYRDDKVKPSVHKQRKDDRNYASRIGTECEEVNKNVRHFKDIEQLKNKHSDRNEKADIRKSHFDRSSKTDEVYDLKHEMKQELDRKEKKERAFVEKDTRKSKNYPRSYKDDARQFRSSSSSAKVRSDERLAKQESYDSKTRKVSNKDERKARKKSVDAKLKKLDDSDMHSDSSDVSDKSVSSLSDISSDSESESWRNKKRGVTRNETDIELEKRRRKMQERDERMKEDSRSKSAHIGKKNIEVGKSRSGIDEGRYRQRERDFLYERAGKRDRGDKYRGRTVDTGRQATKSESYLDKQTHFGERNKVFYDKELIPRKGFEELDSDQDSDEGKPKRGIVSVIRNKKSKPDIPSLLDLKVSRPRPQEEMIAHEKKGRLIIEVAKSDDNESCDEKSKSKKRKKGKHKVKLEKRKRLEAGSSSEDMSVASDGGRKAHQVVNAIFQDVGSGSEKAKLSIKDRLGNKKKTTGDVRSRVQDARPESHGKWSRSPEVKIKRSTSAGKKEQDSGKEKHNKGAKKRKVAESGDADDALNRHIAKIKERNAQILARRQEVEEDRQRYG
ncbi:uncharacterized protein LOC128217433 [Mya arenaria]|uniref:uncharacterized protein LOC128217433 n=1 Tax=Mya arenaria TaxID=6604 RepID=UPI0022E70909|nr:uncharacterized protein LOC128217433 [Mya arenaria]